jgi:hypothetical protein
MGGGSYQASATTPFRAATWRGSLAVPLPGRATSQFSYNSYSVDKDAGLLYVSLVRAASTVNPGLINNLGTISATFSTNTAAPGPGIASANDFSAGSNFSPYLADRLRVVCDWLGRPNLDV